MDRLLYEDLSYKVKGCFYEVYNELGPGHKEQIYHEALKILFKEIKIDFVEEKRINVKFKGMEIGIYKPDFIIAEKIIVEIKSVLSMPNVFEKQLYYYLKSSNYKVGYLVNFGSDKIDIRRRIYETIRNIRENPR